MPSFVCRRLGALGLTLRSGPANTTIAQTTITRADHGGQRPHALFFFASDGRAGVSCGRRQTLACGGLEGENVMACIKRPGFVAQRVFAEPGICGEPVCVADRVGRKNRAAVCEHHLAMSNAGNGNALTHDKVCNVIAPGARVDAYAAVAARVSDRLSDPDAFATVAWCNKVGFEPRPQPRPRAKRIGAAAVAMPAGDQERAAPYLAVAAALRPRSRRRKSSRCLKPLATSLEAIDGRGTREAPRRILCGGDLKRSRQGILPRRRSSGLQVNGKDGRSASSGWLRRPG